MSLFWNNYWGNKALIKHFKLHLVLLPLGLLMTARFAAACMTTKMIVSG
jgi:hypothetical protein